MILGCFHHVIRAVFESFSEVQVGLDIRMTCAEEQAASAVGQFL
jgi:hypothetical protein